ncbi:hypothetical protein glysoja_005183 [Glycine soja]|nr:hypothetical protein glysoja_005183 [Glycine soja]
MSVVWSTDIGGYQAFTLSKNEFWFNLVHIVGYCVQCVYMLSFVKLIEPTYPQLITSMKAFSK